MIQLVLLLIILILIFLIFNHKKEKFTVFNNVSTKYKVDKSKIMNKARDITSSIDAPIIDKVIDDTLLTNLIEHDFDNDTPPNDSYESKSEFLSMIRQKDLGKKMVESNVDNIDGRSIFTIEDENKLLKDKINKERYKQNRTLNNIKNELVKIISLKENINSLQYKNKNMNIMKLKEDVEYYKIRPSKESDIEIIKIYNNIAGIYDDLGNYSEALKILDEGIKLSYKYDDFNYNYYSGLNFHNKGLVKLKMYNTNVNINTEKTEKYRAVEALEHLEKAKSIYKASKESHSDSYPGDYILVKKLGRLEDDIKFAICKVGPTTPGLNTDIINCGALRKNVYQTNDILNNYQESAQESS